MENRVKLSEVAKKANVGYNVAASCMSGKYCCAATVEKVRSAASELGYVRPANGSRKGLTWSTPANKAVFKSRDEETNAMLKLRRELHSNVEISKLCGVSISTVYARIGAQPDIITVASKCLAGATSKAKIKLRKQMVNQQLISEYNALAAQLNKQLEEAKKTSEQLHSLQKNAVKASKAMKVPLLRLLPPTKAS